MKRTGFKRKPPLPKEFGLSSSREAEPSDKLRAWDSSLPARKAPLTGSGFRREVLDASGTGKVLNDRASRRAPLPPRSLKRQAQEQKYRKLRAEFLADRPWCEFPGGCVLRATEVQHRRGRNGARLLQVEWWAASCHSHNMWAEEHTGEALAIGWLVRVNGTAS